MFVGLFDEHKRELSGCGYRRAAQRQKDQDTCTSETLFPLSVGASSGGSSFVCALFRRKQVRFQSITRVRLAKKLAKRDTIIVSLVDFKKSRRAHANGDRQSDEEAAHRRVDRFPKLES